MRQENLENICCFLLRITQEFANLDKGGRTSTDIAVLFNALDKLIEQGIPIMFISIKEQKDPK